MDVFDSCQRSPAVLTDMGWCQHKGQGDELFSWGHSMLIILISAEGCGKKLKFMSYFSLGFVECMEKKSGLLLLCRLR